MWLGCTSLNSPREGSLLGNFPRESLGKVGGRSFGRKEDQVGKQVEEVGRQVGRQVEQVGRRVEAPCWNWRGWR